MGVENLEKQHHVFEVIYSAYKEMRSKHCGTGGFQCVDDVRGLGESQRKTTEAVLGSVALPKSL